MIEGYHLVIAMLLGIWFGSSLFPIVAMWSMNKSASKKIKLLHTIRLLLKGLLTLKKTKYFK